MKEIRDAVVQRDRKEQSGWIERYGDWELEDVSDVKSIHTLSVVLIL
jgi:hypothetical protein